LQRVYFVPGSKASIDSKIALPVFLQNIILIAKEHMSGHRVYVWKHFE